MGTSKLHTLLPLRGLVITLQCTESTRMAFFHQPALAAFLRFLAGSPENFDTLIRIDAPESGRTRFKRDDYYRFSIVGLAGSDHLFDKLLTALAGLPKRAPKQSGQLPFRNNWRLRSVQDMFNGETVNQLSETTHYDQAQLEAEAALWASETSLQWFWLSPARLLKAKTQREPPNQKPLEGEARFVRDEADIDADLLLSRVHSTLADLLRRRGESPAPLNECPPLTLEQAHLFWLNASYRGANKKNKDMGGVSGRFELKMPEPLPAKWLHSLILGQYTGVGQRTSFGWGRYLLQTAEGAQSYRRVLPSNSLIVLAQEEENLSKAWRHVMAGRDMPEELTEEMEEAAQERREYEDWLDIEEADDIADQFPLERLQNDIEKLLWGRYETPDLRGYLIPKKSGGVRALSVPPAYDRVLQRAVQQTLNESLEPLMSEDSHGYRAGRSRITASQAISQAWREGYDWVYESDVQDFFNSVSLQRLEDRLIAIFHNDPVIDAILNWMRAPVIFQDQKIERKRGLPQGSPLSPVMANLMLDDFDDDMETSGFRMIRYADDFVVLCKSEAEAKQAEQRAAASLEEHGLGLHPDKSAITKMQDGFRYLGYLFVNDMALDVSGSKAELSNESEAEGAVIQPHSWLTELSDRKSQQVQSERALKALVEKISTKQAIKLGKREKSGTFVTISGAPAVLSTLSKQLNVYRKKECLMQLPWRSIESILVLGNHQITTQAMHAALYNDVSIHLASGTGYYKGCVTHNRNSQHQATWMQQILAFQDDDKGLYCAKEVIAARLRHMKEVLRQRKKAHDLPVIDKAIRSIASVQSKEQLLGYEGSATREYFAKIASLLPEDMQFDGRNRRPPRDPFNVLLSLGYSQLYALVESVLHIKGLLPWQGFYHQPRGKHAVLASDLMEPFRHFVERTALSVVLRGEITSNDFTSSANTPCLMENAARRKYLALLMANWEIKVKARGSESVDTWLTHMEQQSQSLKNFVLNGEPFKAFRLR